MSIKETKTKRMSTNQIVEEAMKEGYMKSSNRRIVTVDCPLCGLKAAVFYGSKQDASVKYEKVYACACGYRKLFPKNSSGIKRHCKTEGCNALLPAKRTAFCYKCRPYKPRESDTEKEGQAGPENSDVCM